MEMIANDWKYLIGNTWIEPFGMLGLKRYLSDK